MSPTLNPSKGSASMTPLSSAFWISALSSAIEPMRISSFPSSVLHIGSGIPQKRLRDKFQSFAFASQFPKRPSPVDLGFQLMPRLSSCIRSLKSVTFINQESSG